MHQVDGFKASDNAFIGPMLDHDEECSAALIIASVFFGGHPRVGALYHRLCLAFRNNIYIKEFTGDLFRHTGEKNIVLFHHFADGCDAALVITAPAYPCDGISALNIIFIHHVEAVVIVILPCLLNENGFAGRKFCIVNVADHDVKIGILSVMKIVDLTAFNKQGILLRIDIGSVRCSAIMRHALLTCFRYYTLRLTEIRNKPCFDVHNPCGALESICKQFCNDLARLTCLDELTINESKQFIICQGSISGEPLIFLITDKTLLIQHLPEAPYIRRDIELVTQRI